MSGLVTAVSRDATHHLSKPQQDSIRLVEGLGVEGDAHFGVTVQHRSRWLLFRNAPNLRQVHLMNAEFLEELAAAGFAVAPGLLGENVTVRGLDLLALPAGTRLDLEGGAAVQLTGLRNPCRQLDGLQAGLKAATLSRGPRGELIRRAGVMSIVLASGIVRPGATIRVELPPLPHVPLEPV